MSTEILEVLGTTIATLMFLLIPGVVYAYYVLESLIDDPKSYEPVIAAVESVEKHSPSAA